MPKKKGKKAGGGGGGGDALKRGAELIASAGSQGLPLNTTLGFDVQATLYVNEWLNPKKEKAAGGGGGGGKKKGKKKK